MDVQVRPTSSFEDDAASLAIHNAVWPRMAISKRLVTGNEMRNEPIRRLNAHLGYHEAPGRIVMRGPLGACGPLGA